MSEAATLIRHARQAAGLTQRELAARLNMTQSAVAKLERPGSNPTVGTLDRVMAATGRKLQLIAAPCGGVDVDLLRADLLLPMAERIRRAEQRYGEAASRSPNVAISARARSSS